MKSVIRITLAASFLVMESPLAYSQQAPTQPGPAQTQSGSKDIPLGDLVKQGKPTKKARKIITDEDIPPRPPEQVSSSTEPSAGASAASSGQDTASTDKAKGSAPNSPEQQDVQKKIDDLKYSEEAEKRIVQKMEDALADPNLSANRRRMYEETLSLSREQLEKFTIERQKLEQQRSAPNPPAASAPPPQ